MRKVFSHFFGQSYQRTSAEVPNNVWNSIRPSSSVRVTHTGKGRSLSPVPMRRVDRSISISSSPAPTSASGSTVSVPQQELPPISVNLAGPFLSSSQVNKNKFQQSKNVEEEEAVQIPWIHENDERSRRSFYSALLDSSLDVIVSHHNHNNGSGSVSVSSNEKAALLSQLNVKHVLSKNEEMKKVILRVAASALTQLQGEESLHPFIPTASEVFFGGSLFDDDMDLVQDTLTPGIALLLFNALLTENDSSTLDSAPIKQFLLAKAVIETTAGYLLHRTVQETNHLMNEIDQECRQFNRLHQGNKLATLTGDLLVVSLIKNVATTRNNKVLELVMQSLSEFSTTEIAKKTAFQGTDDPQILIASMPDILAESVVFSKGFQSSVLLSGERDPLLLLPFSERLGHLMGLMWKTNYDWMKLISLKKHVRNVDELNTYLQRLREEGVDLLDKSESKAKDNHSLTRRIIRQLIEFWGAEKRNIIS